MTVRDQCKRFPGMPALIIAIEKLGSLQALADAMMLKRGHVANWLYRDHIIPLEHVPFVVNAANDPAVNPLSLRPDFAIGWALLARQLGATTTPAEKEPAQCETEPA